MLALFSYIASALNNKLDALHETITSSFSVSEGKIDTLIQKVQQQTDTINTVKSNLQQQETASRQLDALYPNKLKSVYKYSPTSGSTITVKGSGILYGINASLPDRLTIRSNNGTVISGNTAQYLSDVKCSFDTDGRYAGSLFFPFGITNGYDYFGYTVAPRILNKPLRYTKSLKVTQDSTCAIRVVYYED